MKYYILFGLLLLAGASVAQSAEEDSLVNPELLLPQKTHPYIEASASFGAIAKGISTSRLLKFTSDDFLDQQEKNEFLNQTGTMLRYGVIQEAAVLYREPTYRVFDKVKTGYGLRIRNRYYNSARLDKNLLNLIFYGNKPYEDQELSLGKSAYETWYFTSMEYIFDVMIDSLQPLSLSVGMQIGHDHNHYKLAGGSLYTAPDGEYLDLQLDYQLRDQSSGTAAFSGLGIGLGAKTSFRLSAHSELQILAEDVGVMNWNSGNKLETDSSFRFVGISFNNIFDINDSLTNHKSDQYRKSFIFDRDDSYMSILPFFVETRYSHKTSGKLEQWFISADYRYLSGYFPRLKFGAELDLGYDQSITGEISSGGYNWLSLNASYQIGFASDWHIQVALQNINGLLLPGSFGGALAYVGVSHEL